MIIFNLGEGVLKCVLGWCLPKDYQKLESPRPDSPVHVDINVEILDILSVNDKEFSISMSMYFSVMWQESRIVTNNTIESGFWYPVSLEFLNDLWIPNVFIYNLKSFSSLQVLKRLAGECQSGSDCNYWILNIFIFEKSRTTEYTLISVRMKQFSDGDVVFIAAERLSRQRCLSILLLAAYLIFGNHLSNLFIAMKN